jgi:hypothetical protein
MSFNKRYLPELPELIKTRKKYSSDGEFIIFIDDYYKKADVILGSPECFEYLQEARKKIEQNEQKLGERS